MRIYLVLRLIKRYVIVFAAAVAFIYTLHNSLQQRKDRELAIANHDSSLSTITQSIRIANEPDSKDADVKFEGKVLSFKKSVKKSIKEESKKEESVKEESNKDKSMKEESIKDKSIEDTSTKDKSINDQSIKDKSIKDESIKDRSKDHHLPDLPMHDIDDDIYIQLRDGKADPFPASGKFPLQLKKLKKYHGEIVEKHSSDYYMGVEYPKFIDEHQPKGIGEGGAASKIKKRDLSKEEQKRYTKLWDANSFNEYISEMISVRRSLGDCSSDECKRRRETYPKDLPPVDVIIIFHNEAWSVLLRTVHSILLRTPDHLLGEVILVDDNSTAEYLGAPLEKYFSQMPKVKIVRALVRGGLTKARLLGYYASTSPVLVFLDAHVECFPGYLEPLLAPIKTNWTTVVFPNIERISPQIFNVNCNNRVSWLGIFRMSDLNFIWGRLPDSEYIRRRRKGAATADNIRSPTMPGGLFAISRAFFERVGKYDPELEHWGGENIELSFKTWMCHGTLLLVPCSHIGHIFRSKNPIKSYVNIGNKNSVRVAEVWMDDYKNYYYEHNNFKLSEYGDISERKALRERLKCHDFAWYHHNIYPGMIGAQTIYAGEIRLHGKNLCVDSMGGSANGHKWVELYDCHGSGGSQFWVLNTANQIQMYGMRFLCGVGRQTRIDRNCISGPTQWKYREDKTILHIPYKNCLTANTTALTLTLEDCTDSDLQKWSIPTRRTDINFPS